MGRTLSTTGPTLVGVGIPGNRPKAGNAKKANATSFKPGQSGNLAGRPKKLDVLVERCTSAVDEYVVAAWIGEVKTLGPNWVECSKLLAAYGYGKPTQRLEHDTSTGLGELLKEVYEANK